MVSIWYVPIQKKGKEWNTLQWGTEFSRSPLHSVKSHRSALQLAFRASESHRTACTTMHFKWASALHPHSFLRLVDLAMLVPFVGSVAWRTSPNSLVSSVPLERSSVMWFISIEKLKRTKRLLLHKSSSFTHSMGKTTIYCCLTVTTLLHSSHHHKVYSKIKNWNTRKLKQCTVTQLSLSVGWDKCKAPL